MAINVKIIKFKWSESHSIFSSEEYLRSISSDYNWIGGFSNNELVCFVPYTKKYHKIFGKVVFTVAQFQSSTIYEKEITVEIEKEFLEKAIDLLRNDKVDYIIQPPTYAVFRTVFSEAVFASFGTYKLNLLRSEDELWQGIHQKHRNVIRNAIKNNVDIHEGIEYVDIAYDMIKKTMERSNMGFIERDKFDKVIAGFCKNVKIFVALHNGDPQSCAVIPYSKYSTYYLYGGTIDEPILGANNLLHWKAIQLFRMADVKWYDFVGARINPPAGSKLEGIQRFKLRFGSELQQGFLWKIGISPIKAKIYDLIKKHIKKDYDIIDQEKKRIISESDKYITECEKKC